MVCVVFIVFKYSGHLGYINYKTCVKIYSYIIRRTSKIVIDERANSLSPNGTHSRKLHTSPVSCPMSLKNWKKMYFVEGFVIQNRYYRIVFPIIPYEYEFLALCFFIC